jgi:hypothetical protein
MKSLLHCLIVSFLFLVLIGCEDSTIMPGSLEDSSDYDLPVLQREAEQVFKISPTGDLSGIADYQAIQDAFNYAGPGDKIDLKNGVFYINHTITIPEGFGGIFKGEGKNKTVIIGVGTSEAPFQNGTIPRPNYPPLTDNVSGSAFFYFYHPSTELKVMDLTVRIPENFVSAPNDMLWGNPGVSTDLSAFFIVDLGSEDCNTSFKNINLEGTENNYVDVFPWLAHQPYFGIEVLGNPEPFPALISEGTHKVSNCNFSKIGVQATVHQAFKGASIDILNNTFEDIKQVIVRLLDGVDVTIKNNKMNTFSFGAVVVSQEGLEIPGNKSDVLIANNKIYTDGYAAIEIGFTNFPMNKADFNLIIKNNNIRKGDSPIPGLPNYSAITISNGEEGALIKKNIISGYSQYGIAVNNVSNSLFDKNKFNGFTAEYDYHLYQSDYNTICKSGPTTILDEGTGNQLDCKNK